MTTLPLPSYKSILPPEPSDVLIILFDTRVSAASVEAEPPIPRNPLPNTLNIAPVVFARLNKL